MRRHVFNQISWRYSRITPPSIYRRHLVTPAAGRTLKPLAHLTFTFFRLYRSTFMPHVLYYDSQKMVKNVCFCIAKQQKLDGGQFWIIQTGDNHLEKLFGIIGCGANTIQP